MAYDFLSPDQQELLDLLRNELAEYVGQAPQNLWSDASVQQQHFSFIGNQIEHLARAAQMVGLSGLMVACDFLVANFAGLARPNATRIPQISQAHIERWPVVVLGYLQGIMAVGFAAEVAGELIQYLASEHWPKCMDAAGQADLLAAFNNSSIIVDAVNVSVLPEDLTAEYAGLNKPVDVRAELFDGLIAELPLQTEGFSASIEHYLHTGDASYLLTAQRIAHTVKGAGNVVGIPGIANLMHYCEDFLEAHQKGVGVGGDGFAELLQDVADCLANISDFLQGFAPAPDNLLALLRDLLKALQGDFSYKKNSVPMVQIPAEILPEFFASKRDDGKNAFVKMQPPDELASASAEPNVDVLAATLVDLADEEDLFESVEVKDASQTETLLELLDAQLDDINNSLDTKQGPNVNDCLFADMLLEEWGDGLFEGDALGGHTLPDADNDANAANIAELTSIGATGDNIEGLKAEALPTPSVDAQPSVIDVVDNNDTKPQFNLSITDDVATELLRVAGEMQISNTQVLARVGATQDIVRSALRFQQQLLDLAEDLDKRLAHQGAMAIAAGSGSDTEMDPLELERYNELHSFASRLQEVTTDAQEAVRDAEQALFELKGVVTDQRQLGFEMQGQVLNIRMLPASVLSSRFSRAVRQAARLTHKSAMLVVEGDSVMVDSRVLHTIADPVMHLLRNAVDHGIEAYSSEREKNDKPLEGKIRLSFDRIGESLRIRVDDDGKGIDYEAVKRIAIERGLLESAKSYTDVELQRVMLMPGFTTRSVVTQTSGRGIGLDVVSEQVRQLKGTLSLHSTLGQGTRFDILVPMSVLSAHLLLVQSQGQIMGVISRGLQQIIYLQSGDVERDDLGRWRYLLRGEWIPVFEFDSVSSIGVSVSELTPKKYGALLLTSKADGFMCGIAVEKILASEEHVIKPLGRFTYKPTGVTGAAILGSGKVAPVVDLHDLPVLRFTSDEIAAWDKSKSAMVERQLLPVAQKPVALVVDDSLSARRVLAQFMADLGYDVLSAKDGFEAIAQMMIKVPHIALIDLEMPRMNGLELAAHMRSQQRYSSVPIAMITSRTTAKHKLLANNAGVDVYLNKPWSDDELMSVLTQLLPSLDKAVGE